MNKIRFVLSALFLLFLFYARPALSLGLGVYLSGTGGYNWYNSNSGSLLYNFPAAGGGFGFVLDTAVAKDQLVNFRLNVGEDFLPRSSFSMANMFKFNLLGSLGFGIIRTEDIRLWLGPQVGMRVNYGTGFEKSIISTYHAYFDIISFPYPGPSSTRHIVNTEFVGGLVIGVNFNVGRHFTVAVDAGGRLSLGTSTIAYYGLHKGFLREGSASGYEGFINLAFIYRINDTQKNL